MLWNCHIKPEKLNFFLFNFILLFTILQLFPFIPPLPTSTQPLTLPSPQAITGNSSEAFIIEFNVPILTLQVGEKQDTSVVLFQNWNLNHIQAKLNVFLVSIDSKNKAL